MTNIALAPFLQQSRDRLRVLDAESLRETLTAHAATREPAARLAFLDIFNEGRDIVEAAGDRSLLADIADLVERIRAGEYFDGWGWDDDLHDERAWGDEAWAGEMDHLFARTDQAFLAGDVALACEAYRRLLDALLLDEERRRWLGQARETADTRIAAIVQAKHRGAYDRAAELAVACAEALALTAGSPAASCAITELRDRYPRHVAFRAALDVATTGSPLLPSPPRRRR